MKPLIGILLSFCIFSNVGCYGQPNNFVEESLRNIFSGDFGFVLAGAKPVAIDDCPDDYLSLHPEKKAEVLDYLAKTFIHSKEFVYIPGDHCFGTLVNRKVLTNQIHKYPQLKEFVLSRFGSVDVFLHEIESGTHIFDLLENDDVLISIVLGYGESNGQYYSRYMTLAYYLQKYPIISFYPFQNLPSPGAVREFSCFFYVYFSDVSRPPLADPWKSLDEEFEWMKSAEVPADKEAEPPFFITPPRYMARRCPESDEIHKRYVRARDKLAKLFARGKPSEVIAAAVSKQVDNSTYR